MQEMRLPKANTRMHEQRVIKRRIACAILCNALSGGMGQRIGSSHQEIGKRQTTIEWCTRESISILRRLILNNREILVLSALYRRAFDNGIIGRKRGLRFLYGLC
jgi:hypothetical protein